METDDAVSEKLVKVDAARFQPLAERFDRGSDDRFRRFKSAKTLRQSNDEVTLVAFAPKFVFRSLQTKKRANGSEQFLGVDRLGQIGVGAAVKSCSRDPGLSRKVAEVCSTAITGCFSLMIRQTSRPLMSGSLTSQITNTGLILLCHKHLR